MSSEMSSKWIALLGLLAVAGYKNRDKIADMLGKRQASDGTPGQIGQQDGTHAGSVLGGGLRDLIDRFRGTAQAKTADSWVRTGPNEPIRPEQLEQAIGSDALQQLAVKTGLTREELLSRLSRDLPEAVDKFTPDGRLPTDDEAARLLARA
jgi:uncharacterized protein YidB (DUF937 family)